MSFDYNEIQLSHRTARESADLAADWLILIACRRTDAWFACKLIKNHVDIWVLFCILCDLLDELLGESIIWGIWFIYRLSLSIKPTDRQSDGKMCIEGSLVGHGFAFEQEKKKKNRSGWCGFATSNLCSEISRLYYFILFFAVLYFYSLAQQLFVRILAQPVLFLSVGQIYSPPRTTPDHKSNFTWTEDCRKEWQGTVPNFEWQSFYERVIISQFI